MPNTRLSSIGLTDMVCGAIRLATPVDVADLEHFRKLGKIEHFDEDQQHTQICFNGCADGDRTHIWETHLPKAHPERGGCFHSFLDHAHTLKMALDFPGVDRIVCLYKVDQLGQAFTTIKRGIVTQAILSGHWPCAGGLAVGLSMIEAIVWMCCAKRHVRIRQPEVPEIVLLHKLDTPDGTCLTDKITLREFIDEIIAMNHPARAIWEKHEQKLRETYPKSFHHLT